MSSNKPITFFLAGLASLVAASATAEEIKFTTGGTTAAYVINPIKEPFEKATGIKLTVKIGGGRYALADVDKGAEVADAGGAAHTVQELVEFLKKEGVEVKNLDKVQQHHITNPKPYAVVVHKDNPVASLSKEQLKGIYTGKITNWKDVGGKDSPILVVWPKLQPGANQILIGKILDKEQPTQDVLEVNVYEDVRQAVASNPEALGMVMPTMIDASVKAPQIPSITTGTINFYTLGAPAGKVQKLLDFIKGPGKQHLPN